jgi:hypothetical protein
VIRFEESNGCNSGCVLRRTALPPAIREETAILHSSNSCDSSNPFDEIEAGKPSAILRGYCVQESLLRNSLALSEEIKRRMGEATHGTHGFEESRSCDSSSKYALNKDSKPGPIQNYIRSILRIESHEFEEPVCRRRLKRRMLFFECEANTPFLLFWLGVFVKSIAT